MKYDDLLKKIIPREQIAEIIEAWKTHEYKIVFTNGCFDILHPGHIYYLCKASELGDKLIIGLNSDDSVRRLKGNHRPILEQFGRSILLASLAFVDAICIFDEDTPYELIKTVKPHILVKGNDYKPEEIVGYDIVKQYGGEVFTIELLPRYSTTIIEHKIISSLIQK